MNYRVELEKHSDYGYKNFFDQFRDDYDIKFKTLSQGQLYDFIDSHLVKYHAKIDRETTGTLIFETKAYFDWFVLEWE